MTFHPLDKLWSETESKLESFSNSSCCQCLPLDLHYLHTFYTKPAINMPCLCDLKSDQIATGSSMEVEWLSGSPFKDCSHDVLASRWTMNATTAKKFWTSSKQSHPAHQVRRWLCSNEADGRQSNCLWCEWVQISRLVWKRSLCNCALLRNNFFHTFNDASVCLSCTAIRATPPPTRNPHPPTYSKCLPWVTISRSWALTVTITLPIWRQWHPLNRHDNYSISLLPPLDELLLFLSSFGGFGGCTRIVGAHFGIWSLTSLVNMVRWEHLTAWRRWHGSVWLTFAMLILLLCNHLASRLCPLTTEAIAFGYALTYVYSLRHISPNISPKRCMTNNIHLLKWNNPWIITWPMWDLLSLIWWFPIRFIIITTHIIADTRVATMQTLIYIIWTGEYIRYSIFPSQFAIRQYIYWAFWQHCRLQT